MGIWQFDPLHTQVEFAAKHLGMMTVRGHFTDVKATGHIDPGHPEDTAVEVVVQMPRDPSRYSLAGPLFAWSSATSVLTSKRHRGTP
jgi:hypothetical protein